MNPSRNKLMDLHSAIETFVADDAHLSIGGFTLNRNPMAAVYEIIRQGKTGLHLYAHSNGQGLDELVGGGCISRLEVAYGGTGRFAPTCIRFRKAVQQGQLKVEDYSNYQMTLRFMAGAMGVPFLPTRSGLETDIVNRWGFDHALRSHNPKLPDDKLVVLDNPFGDWGDTPKVVLVPAITPDVTIIHVQQADATGICRIQGLPFADVEQAKAARHLIVTCEELVPTDTLKADPDRNQIPPFCVDAVVHLPWGAFPTACYGAYDYDPVYLNRYKKIAAQDASYKDYLANYIHGTQNHEELLAKLPAAQLEAICADARTGYARGLDRR